MVIMVMVILITIMSGNGDGDDMNVPPPEYECQHWQDHLYWHVALVGISAECSVSLEKYSLKVSESVKVK